MNKIISWTRIGWSALLALHFLLVGEVMAMGSGDPGSHEKMSVCEQTANKMLNACAFDVNDDLFTSLANCKNISSKKARHDCQKAAYAARSDDSKECHAVREARGEACERLGENRYDPDPLLDPANVFIDPDDVPDEYPANPYVSVVAGHTYVLRAGDEGEELVVVHVSGESREILGVLCRVVVDIVVEVEEDNGVVEYTAVEATDDWFAQDEIGNVYYCGEVSRNYEDGVLRDLDGSFEAGIEHAKSGVLMRAFPIPGDVHRQEYSLGEAEDIVEYVSVASAPTVEEGGDNLLFPCGVDRCLKTFDYAPIDPESTEYKYYLPGVGFVLAVAMEDGELTGEREELVCVGDSLAVLHSPECGIDDADALLEILCKLSPDAFCAED